jgi:hypothetical protein
MSHHRHGRRHGKFRFAHPADRRHDENSSVENESNSEHDDHGDDHGNDG